MQRTDGMQLRLLHRALHHLVAALCTLALCVQLHAQTLNLGHQSWTTENGLLKNSVDQIFQSHDGYIWIATEGGIARFNGIDFKIFNHDNTPIIASDDISCFAEDSQNNLWIGTSDGLLQYAANTFQRYTTAEGLPSNDILSLATTADGTLYVLTGSGLARFNRKSFATITTPSQPNTIIPINNALWLTTNTSILKLEQNRTSPVTLPFPPPSEPIQSIGTLRDHILWLRTATTITFLNNGHPRTLTAGRELPGARIESFLADSHGTLWIGTNKALVSLQNTNAQPQTQPALATNSILALVEDREGNIWIGTDTTGLHILRQQSFSTIPALSDHIITAIVQTTDGSIWAATNGDGLDRWQSGRIQHFSTLNGLVSDIILALAPGPHNDIWVGTPDGLNHIQGTHVETYTSAEGLPDDLIRSLLIDTDGTLWIGTRRGLAHWHNNAFTTYTTASGLRSNIIGSLQQPHGTNDLWIGTLDGLSLLHNNTITSYTTANGLSSNIITALYQDSKANLWIGTNNAGLTLFQDGNFTRLPHTDVPQDIRSILGDNEGNLWLTSNRGITRIARSQLLSCAQSHTCDLHPTTYGRTDGMPTEETSAIGHPSAWKTADGTLWFATRKGVAITDPAHLSENHTSPPVVIERFTADETDLPTNQPIPPGHTRFAFQYAGLSYFAPTHIHYRYKLEGFDKQWTDAGTRRTAYYTNLPAGHYTFRVQAATNEAIWSEPGASLTFSIRPPFYRSLWFVLLALAALTALGILLYQLRLRRLRARYEAVLAERNRMAREIHDTLAQSFAGVSVQLELVSQLLAQSQPVAASQQLDRTRAYVREGLAEARRSIWDLRAITAQTTLPTRLTHLVEQSRAEPLTIQLNIGGTYRPLAPAIENEILRITQEALTNIQRHANATQSKIEVRYDPTQLHLRITDNGCGFNPALPQNGHFGLQGIRERAAQINALLDITSSPNQGTIITLDLPTEKGAKQHA